MGDSDKTEEPTDHKLQKAREEGQVSKSQEVTQTMLLVALTATFAGICSSLYRSSAEYATSVYRLIPTINWQAGGLTEGDYLNIIVYVLLLVLKLMIPLLAVSVVVGIAGNLAQIGFLFTTKTMSPKLSKLNPMGGFKRMFSKRSLLELFKQLVKVGGIGYVTYYVLKQEIPTLQVTVTLGLEQTAHIVRQIITKITILVVLTSIVLAAIDFVMQKKFHMKDMKMSFQDLKDEYKETEGNPEVKGKQKQIMRQVAMGMGMGGGAPQEATAVVTNPTHLAVGLKYEEGMNAPTIVAKGENLIAEKIKDVAEENDIAVMENATLAQALFKSCNIGDEIPAELYKAVAEVLAFVFKLKRKKLQRRLGRGGLNYQRR